MARTPVPYKVQVEIWMKSGGRCAYPGCNMPLWKDGLTLARLNQAYIAHIIADSPEGPRGHPELSAQLSKDPANLMLLCGAHHRLVDHEGLSDYPLERMRQIKREHEERIARLTAIQANRRTHILLFGTRIGERSGQVNFEQAREAILPERYPADETGIRIALSEISINEKDPEFWDVVMKEIDRRLQLHVGGTGPGGTPLNHLSVFALAPIPALIYLGKCLGDIISADVYQRQRASNDWQWRELEDKNFAYIRRRSDRAPTGVTQVAVNLSLSGLIHDSEIESVLGDHIPTYTLTIAKPQRDFLQAQEQLELFRSTWYQLLADIRHNHGENCVIHLFPAIPNAIAVELGRALLPKADPQIIVYDRQHDGFQNTITV